MKKNETIKKNESMKKNETINKSKTINKNSSDINREYFAKKEKRRKKAEDIIYSGTPFVLALIVQLVASLVGMLIYGTYEALQSTPGKKFSQIDMENVINAGITMDVSLLISAFSAIACIIVFVIWYIKQMKNADSSLSRVSIKFKHIALVVLVGIGLQIGISYILNLIAMVKPNWFYNYGLMMEQLGNGTSIVSLIYIVVIAPISEELIFRGVLFNKTKRILPLIWANVLQAFLFGLYHMNMIQGIYAFIIGMFLGAICYWFKSIYASIFLHVIINLCGLLVGQITMGEQYQTPFFFSIVILFSVIVIVLSMIMLKKEYVQKDGITINE